MADHNRRWYRNPTSLLLAASTVILFALTLRTAAAIIYPEQALGVVIFGLLGQLLPILLCGIVVFLLYQWHSRRAPEGQADRQTRELTSFSRSHAHLVFSYKLSTRFADVAGIDEAKEELAEVVDFLKHPDKYTSLGARMPKGLLLVGPPGTGKTLLARAVAGEADVPFLSISGSEFVEVYVGVGAARVRDLFEQARRYAPCIVFIDEIDAVGRQRTAGLGGGSDERDQTLNQILVGMDGFDSETNVIVLAATNRPDVLDQALLRPGRFDRQIVLDRPDLKGRLAILQVHVRGKPMHAGVNLDVLASLTPGLSGADLESLVNEAALLAARRDSRTIGQQDLEEAIDRVLMGPRCHSRLISQRERTVTASHEAGHAIVAHVVSNVDRVQRITIVPRGTAGGYTRVLPGEDRRLFTRSEFEETLAWTMGGYAAEQITFGEVSTGASDDLGRATQIAHRMVAGYGMSERLGPITLGSREEGIYLGRGALEQHNYSEKTARILDEEVQALVSRARKTAHSILLVRRDILQKLAEALMEQETLEGVELQVLLGSRCLPEGQPAPEIEDPSAREEARSVRGCRQHLRARVRRAPTGPSTVQPHT